MKYLFILILLIASFAGSSQTVIKDTVKTIVGDTLVTTIYSTPVTNQTFTYQVKGQATHQTIKTPLKNAPPNVAPTVIAGTVADITLPTSSVNLSSVAADSDGKIQSYLWSKVSGGNAVLVSPTAATTSVNNLVAGTYTFRITVSDDDGSTATATVSFVVNPAVIPPTSTGAIMGYGSQVTGGEGYGTVMCNSLTESALKAAIGNGNRIVKFSVSGTIRARLQFSSLKNVTIDGEGKITIDNGNNGDAIALEGSGCSNIIIKNLRIRNAGNDCIGIRCKKVVIDHCSFDKAGDGLVDMTENAEYITISNCIFGTSTSGAMLLAYAGTRNISVYRNVFTAWDRDPLIHRADNYQPVPTTDLMCEFSNNIVWSYTNVGSWIDYGGTGQFKNNYYQKKEGAIVANRDSREAKVFSSGNIAKGGQSVDLTNYAEWTIPAQYRVTLLPAFEAATKVKAEAGCYPLDATDKAILAKISL